MNQFQKEKNYQIDMIKTKNEEDLIRLNREYENKVNDVKKELASREMQGKELN